MPFLDLSDVPDQNPKIKRTPNSSGGCYCLSRELIAGKKEVCVRVCWFEDSNQTKEDTKKFFNDLSVFFPLVFVVFRLKSHCLSPMWHWCPSLCTFYVQHISEMYILCTFYGEKKWTLYVQHIQHIKGT